MLSAWDNEETQAPSTPRSGRCLKQRTAVSDGTYLGRSPRRFCPNEPICYSGADCLGLMNPDGGKAVGAPTTVPRPLVGGLTVFHPRSPVRMPERAVVEPREKVHRTAHKRPSAKPIRLSLSHRAIWGSPRTLSGSHLAVISRVSMSGNSSAFDVLPSLTKRANTSGCEAGSVFLLSTLHGAHQNSRPCSENPALAFAQRVRAATRRACPALR